MCVRAPLVLMSVKRARRNIERVETLRAGTHANPASPRVTTFVRARAMPGFAFLEFDARRL